MDEVDAWLERFRRFWDPAFEALATEIARGKRGRKSREFGAARVRSVRARLRVEAAVAVR